MGGIEFELKNRDPIDVSFNVSVRAGGGSGGGRPAGNRNGTSGRGFGDRKSGNERPGGKCLRQPRSPGSRNGTTGRG